MSDIVLKERYPTRLSQLRDLMGLRSGAGAAERPYNWCNTGDMVLEYLFDEGALIAEWYDALATGDLESLTWFYRRGLIQSVHSSVHVKEGYVQITSGTANIRVALPRIAFVLSAAPDLLIPSVATFLESKGCPIQAYLESHIVRFDGVYLRDLERFHPELYKKLPIIYKPQRHQTYGNDSSFGKIGPLGLPTEWNVVPIYKYSSYSTIDSEILKQAGPAVRAYLIGQACQWEKRKSEKHKMIRAAQKSMIGTGKNFRAKMVERLRAEGHVTADMLIEQKTKLKEDSRLPTDVHLREFYYIAQQQSPPTEMKRSNRLEKERLEKEPSPDRVGPPTPVRIGFANDRHLDRDMWLIIGYRLGIDTYSNHKAAKLHRGEIWKEGNKGIKGRCPRDTAKRQRKRSLYNRRNSKRRKLYNALTREQAKLYKTDPLKRREFMAPTRKPPTK